MESLVLSWLDVLSFDVDRFASPVWLWLMFAWPLLWMLQTISLGPVQAGEDDLAQLQAQRQFVFRHPLIHLQTRGAVDSTRPSAFSWLRMGLQLLRGLVIVSVALALAQPQKVQLSEPLPQEKTVRDVVFVIESSASFLLPDYQVNGQADTRMNVVKSVLDQFIGGLAGNRFGLTIYAQQAYTLMPLSSDQTAARLNLKRLKPYLAGRTDEALGEALGLALKQAEKGMQKGDEETLRRVVVLISDGQSQPSRVAVEEAINYAQMMNVPIYTVGVGASSDKADTRLYSGLLYQPLESASLKQIAAETNGHYYQIGSGDDLQKVLRQIDQTEGVPYLAPPSPPRKVPLYQWPLLFGVAALLLYLLLSLSLASRLSKQTEAATQGGH
ncbi:vWA domain-containing protein [Thiomicrorhabdus chilensis]|uniref:vWA domain-containing protein n=1 Tax=Thiomicrorhabdus chilensis TaxID=63656 RepID=UPI00041DB8B5|nr:VWA domain-containing protein [Thiomicrorhabdus chilensis]